MASLLIACVAAFESKCDLSLNTPLGFFLSEASTLFKAQGGRVNALAMARWLSAAGAACTAAEVAEMYRSIQKFSSGFLSLTPESSSPQQKLDTEVAVAYEELALWCVHTFAESRGGSPVSAQSAYDGFRAAFAGRSDVLVAAFQGDTGNASLAGVGGDASWLPAALRVSRAAFTRCLTRAGYPVLDFEVEAVFSDLCRLADGAIYWPEFVDLVCPELAG